MLVSPGAGMKGGDRFGGLSLEEGLTAYQLVGGVTAYQGSDG